MFGVLSSLLWVIARMNILALLRYLGREFLLILSTSSSEVALPRLIAKMEHLGVSKPVVGITVPTGYSFNLDGTAIYLTMATLFIAEATGDPLSFGEQISLLLFMIIASKGAAGVTGAGLATLAGGLSTHRPELVDGVGLIVGIDRFMSEARALTNFAGNSVATVLVGTWTKEFDREKADRVLSGEEPFDEATMLDDDHGTAGGRRRDRTDHVRRRRRPGRDRRGPDSGAGPASVAVARVPGLDDEVVGRLADVGQRDLGRCRSGRHRRRRAGCPAPVGPPPRGRTASRRPAHRPPRVGRGSGCGSPCAGRGGRRAASASRPSCRR